MNRYVAAKKSFFSKLIILGMVFGMTTSLVVPMMVSAQTATSACLPGWTSRSNNDSYTNKIVGAITPAFIDEDFSYLRNKEGLGSTNADSNYELANNDVSRDHYVGDGLNKILGTEYPTEGIYSITVNREGVHMTTYYAKGSNFSDGKDKAIAFATKDGLCIPPQPIKKLEPNSPADSTSTDLTTEAGVNNWFDTNAKPPRQPGTYTSMLRQSDTSPENMERLRQERDTAQARANEIQKQIDALTDKESAGTITPTERQELSRLITQRDVLLYQAERAERQKISNQIKASGSEIDTKDCNGWFGFFKPACWVVVIAIVSNIGMNLVAYALGLVGTLFDYSIELAVNSAEFIGRIGVVSPIWTLLRDLLNMTFIFVLVWIAIHIILQRKNYTIKGDVVRVVVVAILINFSLFAAKVMVDGSNLLTLQLYEAIRGEGVAGKPGNISYRIMNTLGFPTMYNFSDIFSANQIYKTVEGCGGANGTIISAAIFGSIFMIILGLAFLMAGVLFFTRMANIVYLFITSPLWVWGHIMDGGVFAKVKNDWWKRMVVVIKFPVVFMLYMFVAVFAFTKLFALSYGLKFLTLFCASDDKSMLGQLPLILNFCLVIWVVLAAIKYGQTAGQGGVESAIAGTFKGLANKSSIGLAAKLAKGARDKAQQAGGMAAEGLKQAPKAALYGAGQLAKGGFQAAGGFKALNKIGAAKASDANAWTWTRNLGGRLAESTKNPKFFGTTKKQRQDARAKWFAGNGAANADRAINVAEDANTAPTFQEKGHEGETELEFKDRLKAFARQTARIYLGSNIMSTVDDDRTRNPLLQSHEDAIIEDAMNGVTPEKDSSGAVISYKFNQTHMRQRIADTYDAHMPDGRLKHLGQEHKAAWIMSNAKRTARQKATRTQAQVRVTTAGSQHKANTHTLESLKDQLKIAEADLVKHPLSLDQLNVWLAGDPTRFKGILDPNVIAGLERDIVDLEGDIGIDEHDLSMTTDPTTQARLQRQIDQNKKKKTTKETKVKSMKEKVVKNREAIQKKINKLNNDIKKKEEDEKNKTK